MEKRPKITTPLTVIGAFLALVEAIALATLSTVSGDIQIILTYFVILFPVLVSIAFFYTLWFRPYVFYPPSEYGERTSVTEFVDAIMQQPQHRDEQLIAINRLSIAKLVSEKADDEIIQSHEIIIETQQQENINRNDDWMMPFNEGNYQEAINLIAVQKEIATEDSDIFVLSYYSAVALTYLDFNKAFVEFRKLIDEAPFVSFPYAALADAYERMNLTKEELEVVEQAIERISDETKPEFLLRKARILLKQKEIDAAIKLALEVGKTSDPIIRSHVYRLLGQINMQQGNKDEAQKSFLSAFRATPTDPECIKEVGKYFAEIGDTNLELYFINHLVEISPNHSDYWGVLGNAQYARGYRDIAWESYNKAIELSEIKPGWVLSNIGNLFHSVELYSCAIENLKESLTLDPNSAYSQQRFADATKAKLENHKEWNKKLSEIKVQARSLMDQLA